MVSFDFGSGRRERVFTRKQLRNKYINFDTVRKSTETNSAYLRLS